MTNQEEYLAEKISCIDDLLQEAAAIEKKLPDRDRRMLDSKSGWCDYVYDEDDRKDQEPESVRMRLSAAQIALLDRVQRMINFLGLRHDVRTVVGKKILWARACGASYRDIAFMSGKPPSTCERWCKSDLRKIAMRVVL